MSTQKNLLGLTMACLIAVASPAYADDSNTVMKGPDENGVWELNADGKADPVSSAQMYGQMRYQGGQSARNYRHQILAGDFTCDGVLDRITGWVDLDSPEGPQFALLFVTNHGGVEQSEIRYIPFESAEQFALCIHDETAPPVLSWQENEVGYMREVVGNEDLCNIGIRVDDFMCDAPQFFYSGKPDANDEHWVFFRN